MSVGRHNDMCNMSRGDKQWVDRNLYYFTFRVLHYVIFKGCEGGVNKGRRRRRRKVYSGGRGERGRRKVYSKLTQ